MAPFNIRSTKRIQRVANFNMHICSFNSFAALAPCMYVLYPLWFGAFCRVFYQVVESGQSLF